MAYAKRLFESSVKYNFSFSEALIKNFVVAEIDELKMHELKANFVMFLKERAITIDDIDSILLVGDFLTMNIDRRFDIVI